MVSFTQLLTLGLVSTVAFGTPLEQRQDNTGCRICIDKVNNCGRMYGGCWDRCKESRKVFDVPACEGKGKGKGKGKSGEREICEYFKNDCGKTFGGCYKEGGPAPLWGEPTCP